jgi:signal transduction histidine kinase
MLRNEMISFIPWIIFLLLSLPAHGDEKLQTLSVVELHQGEEVELLQHTQMLEDIKSELTWQQAMKSQAWALIETDDLNLGISQSTYWFQVRVKYSEDQTRIYKIHYPLLDYVDFYLLDQKHLIKHVATGDARPFKSRLIEDKDFVLSHFDTKDKILTLLIKIKTQGTMVLPLTSVDIEHYAQEKSLETIGYGIYFGISLAMLLYNFMLLIYLKEKSYLYYCTFVFIILISALAYTGYGFKFLWPEYSELNRYITPIASAVGFLAASVFMASFLRLNSRGRWGKNVYYSCISLSVFVIFISVLLSYSSSIRVMSLAQLLLTVMFLGTSIYLWIKGVSEAKYFTIAWLFFILGNMISAFRVLGIIPSNLFTIYANLYGNVFEMLLLSMGLAYRFEAMREVQIGLSRELRHAQQNAIKNLEKYRDLFQKSPVGLFRYDRGSDKFYNNEKSNFLINKHEDVREFLQDELTFDDYKSLLKSSELKDKVIMYGDGTYYTLSLLAIRNERGRIVEIEGSLLDVSEQKYAENLRIANEQEKLNSLTQLVFGISHQFNTPLGVMISTEGLIKENLSKILDDIDHGRLKKEALSEVLTMIKDAMLLASENTKAMSSMLDSLRYSINTRDDLNLSEIKTESFFEDFLRYFKAKIKKEEVTCLLNIDVSINGIDTLYSDYDVLSDVFVRLYMNTYYHAYSKDDREGRISINLSQNDQYVCIEYSDDGRGLSDAEQENIFIPFYTGNSRKKGNSGLGMYILHNQIVNKLQGRVELKSPESGFAINILLPKKYAPEERLNPAKSI